MEEYPEWKYVCIAGGRSDFRSGDARCSVRVFKRYSHASGNRISMSLTFFQNGNEPIQLSAITAGGSQALLFKIIPWGEEAFLDKLREPS